MHFLWTLIVGAIIGSIGGAIAHRLVKAFLALGDRK